MRSPADPRDIDDQLRGNRRNIFPNAPDFLLANVLVNSACTNKINIFISALSIILFYCMTDSCLELER